MVSGWVRVFGIVAVLLLALLALMVGLLLFAVWRFGCSTRACVGLVFLLLLLAVGVVEYRASRV